MMSISRGNVCVIKKHKTQQNTWSYHGKTLSLQRKKTQKREK